MNNNFLIRRATIDDAELLSKLGRTTFYDTFNGTCTKADMQQTLELFYNIEQTKKDLSDENDFFFLNFQYEKAIGYYRMKVNKQLPFEILAPFKSIELKRFYFLQEAKGTGAAQVLMQHVFDLAKSLQCNKIYLSVWEYNIRAQEFYKRNGFINTGIPNPFPIGSTPQTDYWFWMDL